MAFVPTQPLATPTSTPAPEVPAEDVEFDDVYTDDDASLDAEDVEEDVAEDDEDAAEDDLPEGDDAPDAAAQPPKGKADKGKQLFDAAQQAEVNRIVKERLDRQSEALIKDLSRKAGIDISNDEVTNAARLWGLLKSNPELSGNVDKIIAEALSTGKAKAPENAESSESSIAKRLVFKEAVLDLKASDATFNKNSDKVLAWAETEGYDVNDAKTLKLAYLAWKSEQGKVADAVQKVNVQRKQAEKKALQKKAAVQSTKTSSVKKAPLDYAKMDAPSILASEGLSLFTDD